jgi:predicted nucleic acid-binding Zn ribbon protein
LGINKAKGIEIDSKIKSKCGFVNEKTAKILPNLVVIFYLIKIILIVAVAKEIGVCRQM